MSSSDDRKPARGGAVRPLGTVSNLRAILFMCAAVSLFPFLNASVKLLSADYPTAQIVWIRYLGHLVFMLIVFMMPHPERASDPDHGGNDGRALFDGLIGALSA